MMEARPLCAGRQCLRAFQSQSSLPARSRPCRLQAKPDVALRSLVVRASREDELAQLASTKSAVSEALSEKEKALKSGSPSPNGDAGAVDAEPTGLRELTKDDFWGVLEENGDKLVVVDFFTDWCGPCKVMYPTLCKMAEEQPDVTFVKLNCNKYNKDLGKQLGVRVAPTFQLYKQSKKVAELTGAKVEELQRLIDEHK